MTEQQAGHQHLDRTTAEELVWTPWRTLSVSRSVGLSLFAGSQLIRQDQFDDVFIKTSVTSQFIFCVMEPKSLSSEMSPIPLTRRRGSRYITSSSRLIWASTPRLTHLSLCFTAFTWSSAAAWTHLPPPSSSRFASSSGPQLWRDVGGRTKRPQGSLRTTGSWSVHSRWLHTNSQWSVRKRDFIDYSLINYLSTVYLKYIYSSAGWRYRYPLCLVCSSTSVVKYFSYKTPNISVSNVFLISTLIRQISFCLKHGQTLD